MRIAVISARYGLDIVGGAETLARGLLEELVARGHYVEVWTTCAHDYQTWQNTFIGGREMVNGVCVRRFTVDPWDADPFEGLTAKLLEKGQLPVEEQYAWIESGPSSAALYAHTANYQANFDFIVVIPVISTLIFQAACLVLERLVVWPCLHDEIFAYQEPFRLLMEQAKGNIFNSPEERDLAESRLKMNLLNSAVIGSGVVLHEQAQLTSVVDPPYLLYIGRMDEGKNLPLLVEYVNRYVDEGYNLKLKTGGTGNFRLPNRPAFEHMGFVGELDKAELYAGALVLCQPSVKESFSLTMMESWLAGRPSLVHKNCAVTRGHVRRARAGLWFETYGEFRGALNWFQRHPDLSQRMGLNGRKYVHTNYTWPIVTDRFLATLRQWQQEQ